MNKIFLLLRAQVYNTFSLNEIIGKDNKNKNYTVIMGIGIFLLIAFTIGYTVFTALSLVSVGQQDMIPSYMVATSSFIILGFTLLCSNGILFASKDYYMLSSLPLSNRQIISSKFAFMYSLSFLLCILFMLPTGIIWIGSTTVSTIFFLVYLLGIVFVPLVPICIAMLLGILVTKLSSYFQNKNIFSLLFSLLFLGGLLGIVLYNMGSKTDGESMSVILSKQISSLYPPSMLFIYNNTLSFVLNISFYIVSVLVFYLSIKVAGVNYMQINALMLKSNTKSQKKVDLKKRTQIGAMYHKEVGRFFTSYLYMLNTGLGVISLCVLCLLVCIVPLDVIARYTGFQVTSAFIGQYGSLIIASMLTISCTTSSSISLEGINIQILQSVPLSKKAFINAKILFNLSLHAVAYIIAIIVFTLRFQLDVIQIVPLIIVPGVYSIFISVVGIYFNNSFPKFDWDNEVIVIKQSIAVILSSIIGLISVVAPTLLHFVLDIPLQTVLWFMVLFLLLLTAILYQRTLCSKIIN